ncbi:hypothetical protein RclHR1_08270008 [Rhizophagus clarus]|uniref:BTB domain-containing protein n=1 Tax=Rhizophagus clarus TaxID=94130 RepID=A0A2Z6S278_9GLOM|nr:hypothetical protein RclHR1_08270008 [Rhizophagus clarus]
MKKPWFNRPFKRKENNQNFSVNFTLKNKDLSEDIGMLLETSENYDVIIYSGEENDIQKFKAHSQILSARSPYFRAALSDNWAKKEGNTFILKKPNIPPSIFKVLLIYLYTGVIELEKIKNTSILKILVAADELSLQKLIDYIQSYLIDKKSEFLYNDPILILQLVFHNEDHAKLRDFCLEAICNEPEILFNKKDFLELDESLFLTLIKQDTLRIEELEIWKNLLIWAIARCSLSINISHPQNWTKRNFDLIRNEIKDFIPHIRWLQIPANEFWREVEPFKDLLPDDLYQDVIGFHLDPETDLSTIILPRRTAPISTLIKRNHFAVIASWIDKSKKCCYKKSMPYSFSLLYRASKDGFETQKFHELCDYKGATIIIAKIKNKKKLIGGYNPFDWKPYISGRDESYQPTSDSFIFSFVSKSSKNGKVIRVTSPYTAVSYGKNYGPCFGGGGDLKIENSSIMCKDNSSYSKINSIISKGSNYSLEDYEVFQVIKK